MTFDLTLTSLEAKIYYKILDSRYVSWWMDQLCKGTNVGKCIRSDVVLIMKEVLDEGK
jgi:hypothetical protein